MEVSQPTATLEPPARGALRMSFRDHLAASFWMSVRYQIFVTVGCFVLWLAFVAGVAVADGLAQARAFSVEFLQALMIFLPIALFGPQLIGILRFLRLPADAREVTYEVTAHTITTRDKAGNAIIVQWDQLKRATLWPGFLFLGFRTRNFRMLAKKAFSAEDFARITAYARAMAAR